MSLIRIHVKAAVFALAVSMSLASFALPRANAQTEPPKIIRKSGSVLQASVITRVEPIYPPLAKAARVSGAVIVEVLIDEDGKVISAQATSGHPLLKDAAVTAARGWTFQRTELTGVPVKVIGSITLNFQAGPTPGGDRNQGNEIADAKLAVEADPSSAEAHLALGHAYAVEGRYEEAIVSLNESVRLKQDYKEAYVDLAFAYQRLNRREEEILTYKQAVEAFPDATDLLMKFREALKQTERLSEAVEIQRKIVYLKPEDADGHYELGFLLHRLHRYEAAISAYAEAVRLHPDYPGAHYNIGLSYTSLKRYDDALAAYYQALSAKPPYQPQDKLYYSIGLAYLLQKRYAEAEAAANQVIQLNPNHTEAYGNLLARIYHDKARYEDALQALTKATELKADDINTLLLLGDVYGHLHRYEEAEKTMRAALRVKPDSAEANVLLANALFRQKKVDEGEAVLKRGVLLAPGNTNGQLLLGNLLAHQGRTAEAEQALRRVLQVDPNNHRALNALGYSMVERNDKLGEAFEMIQRAVNAEPGNGHYLDSLGWAYFKLGNLTEAERYLTESARINASSSVVNEHLGDLYQRQKKSDEARAAWRKALSLSPEPEQTARLKAKLAGNTK